MNWQPVVGVLISFLSGALPLSYWLGKLALNVDIRTIGDGNPGAFNVLRAGGAGWFSLAMVLDFLKGALPVGILHYGLGFQSGALIGIALAPIFGHAFSPFLGFRGGKALAVTFGVWSGLTLWSAPLALGLFFGLFILLLRTEAWAVIAGQLGLLLVLSLYRPDPAFFWVWGVSMAVFLWTFRVELKNRPKLRSTRRKNS